MGVVPSLNWTSYLLQIILIGVFGGTDKYRGGTSLIMTSLAENTFFWTD